MLLVLTIIALALFAIGCAMAEYLPEWMFWPPFVGLTLIVAAFIYSIVSHHSVPEWLYYAGGFCVAALVIVALMQNPYAPDPRARKKLGL